MNAVPWRGASYDWVGTELLVRCYPEGNATRIRMNFLGDVSQPENKKISLVENALNQQVIDENLARPIDLEFWVKILNGQIGVEIGYSSNQFDTAFIENLVDGYFDEIKTMIETMNTLNTNKENSYVAP